MLCSALHCTALHSLTVKIPFSIPLLNFLNTPLMIPLSLPPSLHPSPYHTIGASQLRMVEICQPCNDVASVMTGSKVRSRPFIYWFIYLLNVHRDIYLKHCCLTYLIFLFICIINLFIVMHELVPYCAHKTNSDDGRLVASLADLLNGCLALDPKDRISVLDAYHHSFFTQKG